MPPRGRAVFVTDAALLVEAGVHLRFDRLVVVHCSPEEQLRRLMARDGLSTRRPGRALAGADAHRGEAALRPLAARHLGSGRGRPTAGPMPWRASFSPSPRSPRAPAPLPIERALALLALGPARGPRGLDPVGLAARPSWRRAASRWSGSRRRLVPPERGPGIGEACAAEPGPETLVGPLVLWTLARDGPDPRVPALRGGLPGPPHPRRPGLGRGRRVVALALLEAAVRGLRRRGSRAPARALGGPGRDVVRRATARADQVGGAAGAGARSDAVTAGEAGLRGAGPACRGAGGPGSRRARTPPPCGTHGRGGSGACVPRR